MCVNRWKYIGWGPWPTLLGRLQGLLIRKTFDYFNVHWYTRAESVMKSVFSSRIFLFKTSFILTTRYEYTFWSEFFHENCRSAFRKDSTSRCSFHTSLALVTMSVKDTVDWGKIRGIWKWRIYLWIIRYLLSNNYLHYLPNWYWISSSKTQVKVIYSL